MFLKLCTGLFLQVIFMVSTSQGSQCYNCTSLQDRNCRDPFNSTGMMAVVCTEHGKTTSDDDALRSVCFKETTKVDGEWQYKRGCAWDGKDRYIANTTVLAGNVPYAEYCIRYCKWDMCNPASNTRASALLIAIFLFLAYILHV